MSDTSISPNEFNSSIKDNSNIITLNEKVSLTKDQYEILNIICKIYQIPVSEYMQQALVEA
jgi:hypothetical protein